MRHLALNAESIDGTLAEWSARWPEMGVLALLPEAEKDRLPLLQEVFRKRGIPLCGALFPALVTAHGFISDGVWLLPFPHRVPSMLIPALNEGEPPASEKIASAVRSQLSEQGAGYHEPTLYMIFDGMVPNIASILEGLYLDLGDRVTYAGVNAGSETFQPMPCLFDAERVVSDGVLCLLLPQGAATVLEHGFSQPERTISATSTDGNRIAMIDWRPAFEVYQELIKSQYGIDLTRDNFYQYAVHFPFGILRASDEVVVRIPVALTDDGSLYCVGEVPENSMLVLLQAPAAGAGGCIDRLADNLQTENGSLAGRQLLTFYCAGRRMHLGDNASYELASLNARTGVAELGGALSLGEIGSTRQWGYPMFHNATLVCTPWNLQ